MDPMDFATKRLGWLPPGLLAWLEKRIKRLPAVRRRIDQEISAVIEELEEALKPYRSQVPNYQHIPEQGLDHSQVLSEMNALRDRENDRWQQGYASGAVYHGDREHIDFLNQIYAIHSQTNPLHADLWPSLAKYEAEIVAMTAEMLGGRQTRGLGADKEICGTASSGGTESILLAMKAYRDWGRQVKGVRYPEMIAPNTAHAAFEKAAQYFGMRIRKIPVDKTLRADLQAAQKALNRNTVVIVGSAPSFPHGVIDPITELSELARQRGIGFHTDACLGGFVLPWAKKLGYPVPDFDFRLPGVTSISVDTHKYGYALKGSSVVLYRGQELRHYQYFATGEWPGGLYCSPTFAGSRPGALIAACWAAMVSTGADGYLQATRQILETAAWIKEQIRSLPQLRILGDPLWVIAFTSDELDIFQINDAMTQKGWSLNGLFSPPAVHLCVTLRHTQPGVAERFIADLQEAIEVVRHSEPVEGGLAPVYGLAASVPFRGMVEDLLRVYLDALYKL